MEKEKELNEKCRKLPLQVRRISVSLNGVTDCPSSIPARQSESNALEIESIHAPSKMAHRRDVRCSGPTTWFRTKSPFVLVYWPYDVTVEFVEGACEVQREKAPTALLAGLR